jgi:hypothetical protein
MWLRNMPRPSTLYFHHVARIDVRDIAGVPDSKMSPGCSVMVRAMSDTR